MNADAYNWRKSIRSSNKPPTIGNRPTTPPLIKSINKRTRKLKKDNCYQNYQFDWINYYNKLINEYKKIELELNALSLNIDDDNNLHLHIKNYRHDHLQWVEYINDTLNKLHQNEITYTSINKMKDRIINDMFV